MAGVQPTIVYCPYDRYITVSQIVEKNFVIQEIPVNVMYMDDIGTYCFYLTDKSSCHVRGSQSVAVKQS